MIHDEISDHPGAGTLADGYEVGSLTEGLVAYYPLQESGSTILHNGALGDIGQLNGPTWQGSGQVGEESLSFDGTDDWVDLVDISQQDAITIALWSRHETVNDGNEDRDITIRGNNSFIMSDLGDGTYRFAGNDSGGTFVSFTGSVSNDTWTHWTLTWDGSTLRGYKDGSSVGSTAMSGVSNFGNGDSMGADFDGTDLFLTGRLDDVRIYNRVLSVPEIEALANRTESSGREITESRIPSQSDNGVSRYEFEQDVTDSWGTNDGTDNTSAGFVNGVYGQAKSFDGTDDWVNLPNNFGIFDGTHDFTISTWVRHNTVNTGTNQEYVGTFGEHKVELRENSDGTIIFAWYDGTNFKSATSRSISAGNWYHIVGVWDADGDAELYLNGDYQGGVVTDTNPQSNAADNAIGQRGNDAFYHDGDIDDVRIYNQALSPTEVERLFNKGAYRINRADTT